jgi:hypothetical protein
MSHAEFIDASFCWNEFFNGLQEHFTFEMMHPALSGLRPLRRLTAQMNCA